MNALFPSVELEIFKAVARLGLTFEVRDDAPNTFEALKAQCPGRHLIVWSGGSDNTVWSSPQVNYAFRAWHDYIHVQYGIPFTLEGEREVARIQCRSLSALGQALIQAEVEDQAEHFIKTGEFVADQRAFVLAKLRERGAL